MKLIISLFELFFMNNDEQKDSSPKNQTSALTQERAKTVDEKAEKTGYETIIRIISTGNNHSATRSNLINIISSFRQFNYPEFNGFVPTIRHNEDALIKNYIFRYFKKPFYLKQDLMNTEEIASVFHFPHIKYNKTPEIKWQNFKIVKAPTSIPKE